MTALLHQTTKKATTTAIFVTTALLLLLTTTTTANGNVKGYYKELQNPQEEEQQPHSGSSNTIPGEDVEEVDDRLASTTATTSGRRFLQRAKNKQKVAHLTDEGGIQVRGGMHALYYMNGGKGKKGGSSKSSKTPKSGKSTSGDDECPEGCCGLTNEEASNILHNQTIIAIFGDGNPDNGWSLDDRNGIVVALRAKIRGAGGDCADGEVGVNGVNQNGNGIFYMPTGSFGPCSAFPTLAPAADQYPIANWNVEVSIDVDRDTGDTLPDPNFLNCLQYEFGFDADPTTGTNFQVVPVNSNPICASETPPVFYLAGSFGDDMTDNGDGSNPGTPTEFANALNTNPIAQGSQNPSFDFWDGLNPSPRVDPEVEGFYDFFLAAKCGDETLARIDITVVTLNLTQFEQCQPGP